MTYHPKLDKILFRMGDYMKFKSKWFLTCRILFTVLTLLLIGFIFSNSVQTADVSSVSSGRIMNFLNGICGALGLKFVFTQEIVRTLAHFGEFGLLGVLSLLSTLSCFGIKVKSLILSFAVFSLTALADECIQLFSDGRAFQLSDLVIDISGGLLGAVAVFLIALLVHNHKIKVSGKES